MFLKLPHILFEAAKEFVRDRCEQLAGAIAFFELLSVAPLAALFYIIFSSLPGLDNVKDHLAALLENLFNPQVIDVLKLLLQHLENMGPEELSALSVSGVIGLLISTTGFYGQIKDCLEVIWNERRDQANLKEAFKRRFDDFLVSVVGSTIIFLFLGIRLYTWDLFPDGENILYQLTYQMLLLTALNYYFFAFLPPVKFKRIHALPGAMLGAVLHIAGKHLFDQKILAASGLDASDEAQTLIVLLLWFYYSAVIRLYCAQFSKVYIEMREGFNVLKLNQS
jgi:membrane protein